jgi:hypothetical protein
MGFIAIRKSTYDALPEGKKKRVCAMPEGVLLLNPEDAIKDPPPTPVWHDDGERYYTFCHPALSETDATRILKFLAKKEVELVAIEEAKEVETKEAEVVEVSLATEREALDLVAVPKDTAPVFFLPGVPDDPPWGPDGDA